MRTSLEIHSIETEKNFVVRHNISLLLDLSIWTLRMPCSYGNVVVLTIYEKTCIISHGLQHTSVKLTGTSLPTMLPTVEAFCRIFASCSFASARFAATCSSSSFFFTTSSSAFSFAYFETFSTHPSAIKQRWDQPSF